MQAPFLLHEWIENNKHLLKPPVGNYNLYKEAGDFIVMIVGGPNSRKDFHFNETEELFYQLKGDIIVKIHQDGKIVDIPIAEGQMFLLPGRVPHSPQRKADTIGLVIEKKRANELDAFMWFCEQCGNKLHEHYVNVADIVTQLPPVMNSFYNDLEKRTCKSCGAILEPPIPVS